MGSDLETKLKTPLDAVCEAARQTGGTEKVCVKRDTVSKDTCKGLKDKKDACGLKLVEDCIDGALQQCDIKEDANLCTKEKLDAAGDSKPECSLRVLAMCRKVAPTNKQVSKADCISYFDGCNMCTKK